ncbi:putative transcription factor/ chromatin remodeling BED-type(Zn) family [Helianthus annuus]|nr:putative transcription factor/ chromatin remodeling BED-type(Zn) family [Helianthus annuus]
MSSNIESVVAGANTPNVDPVELSDEDIVELNEEANDIVDETIDNEGDGSKRKSSSGAWSHFTTVEVKEDRKMVKKHECMHCKKKYAPQSSRTTSHLLRHLKKCAFVKRLKDVKTRWNSTHRMLESAMYYKLAFQGYALRDSNFEWSLTDDEWNRAQKVCKVLEVFLDATNLFSGTSYPTTNLFLVEIFKVKKEITSCYISNDGVLKKMSEPMFQKFEKYWGEIGVLMAIASILDPRFKKVSISWTFGKLYPSNEVDGRVEDVINRLQSLYVKYSTAFHMARASKNNMTSTSSGAPDIRDRLEDDFYAFLKSRPVENTQKSEVEVYLEEPNYIVLENKEFDVLSWWSQNSSKFPVLSKMARNIFSIPITTVASESAFSAGGRILDDYRSSLTKDMVELLVCGGDWIKSTSKTTIQTLQQLAMEEEI